MKHDLTPPPRALKTVAWLARAALWLVLGLWVLFALSWGVLHAWIVPRIGDYRPQLERMTSRALGLPVRIGSIEAVSSGAIPGFELRDVRLFDAQNREALHLPRVLGALSVASLWRLGFEQLVIDGASLDVRRDPQGQVWVAGLPLQRGTDSHSRPLDWLLDQNEFVVRGGSLRWHDESRGLDPVELSQLTLAIRNSSRRHQLRLDASPPPEWGTPFSLRADLREPLLQMGANNDWRQWTGTAYAEFKRVDLRPLNTHLDTAQALGLATLEGQGALRVWLDLAQGRLNGVTADLALDQARVQATAELPPLALQQLGGRVSAQWSAQRWEVRGERLQWRDARGRPLSPGGLRVVREAGSRGGPASIALQADRLDLEPLGALAVHVPLPDGWRDTLATLQARGRAEGVQLRAELPAPGADSPLPRRWQAKGRVVGLALQPGALPRTGPPQAARPGVQGATMDFDISETGGKARVQLPGGTLTLPGVFEDPVLGFQALDAELQWRQDGDRLEVQVPQLRFANADAAGELRASWRTGEGAHRLPGVLDLTATLSRANGARVHRYLPLEVDEDARHYLRDALRQGQASDARLRIRGDLHAFPFAQASDGEFRVSASVSGVDYDYAPTRLLEAGSAPWPGLRGLQGEFVMERDVLSVNHASGTVAGSPALRVSEVQARLSPYTEARATVVVQGKVSGPAGDMLAFVRRSPLDAMTDRALTAARSSGAAQVDLQLELPLAQLARSRVNGRLHLGGNDLRLRPDLPLLERASGQLVFTESGFQVHQAQARVLGGELRFDGGMRTLPNGSTRIEFQGQGQVSAEGLRRAGEQGLPSALASLGQNATGSTAYQLRLAFAGPHTEIGFSSSLQGLALQLPAPLGKTAESSLPLRLDSGPRLLTLDLGGAEGAEAGARLLSARYELDGSATPRVLRGHIAVGSAPASPPARGVSLELRQATLDLDRWSDWLGSLGDAGGAATPFAPTTVQAQVSQLRLGGRQFNHLNASASRDGPLWRARLRASEFDGQLEYRPQGGDGARLFARLERLVLGPSEGDAIERLLARPRPSSVPALDVVVERFVLGERELGRLEIQAVNRGSAGEVREWRLNQFSLGVPEARLSGTGNWALLGAQAGAATGNQRRTALQFRLDIQDSGALLQRLGMPGTLRGGRGSLSGSVGWLGSPLALDTPSLHGQLRLDLERGQFLKADPGIAKLLGVLSLQALPRRLALDFRDVFSEGFAFDFVRGDARIEQGVAHTNNLQMKGVNAAVLLEGKADIVRETQDLSVVVVPEINAGTASLIATAINPAIGLGSFLAQFLLRQPLQSANTQQFQITGSWADPQVVRQERRAPASAPPGTQTP